MHVVSILGLLMQIGETVAVLANGATRSHLDTIFEKKNSDKFLER